MSDFTLNAPNSILAAQWGELPDPLAGGSLGGGLAAPPQRSQCREASKYVLSIGYNVLQKMYIR